MDYKQFSRIKQNAVNNASWNKFVFWAFSYSQFEEGVKKTNAKKSKKGQWLLHSIPGGGFITRAGYATWTAFWANWSHYEKKFKNDEEFIIKGLIYEYYNHEAMYNSDSRDDAERLFPQATQKQKDTAWKKFWKECCDKDLF